MKVGDKVRCVGARDLWFFTKGKVYEVKAYYPAEQVTEEWASPAYIAVTNDRGKDVDLHADRFEVVG